MKNNKIIICVDEISNKLNIPVSEVLSKFEGKVENLTEKYYNVFNLTPPTEASSHRQVADLSLFDMIDENIWEKVYELTMDKKYAKGTRNFSKNFPGKKWSKSGNPPIYVIPRERAGPSYKSIPLIGADSEDVLYAPVSKGFPMQDVSTFTLGPIIHEGLCLVNAAFSKAICVHHIEGGGVTDLKKKNFWKRSKKPTYNITYIDKDNINVNGKIYNTIKWLKKNEHSWFKEWNTWRKSVALCSRGDFHWIDETPVLCYRKNDEYLDFVGWKKECYIKPSYKLLPKTKVFQYLKEAWKEKCIPLGLVHPEAITGEAAVPITKEFIKKLYNSKHEYATQPYVIAGKLMNVDIE